MSSSSDADNVTPPYRIETAQLVLRCWEPADAPALKCAVDESLDHLHPWLPFTRNEPQTVEEKVQLLRRFRGNFDLDKNYIYGAFDRQDETRVLGGTGLHPTSTGRSFSTGYWVHRDALRRGLATEMAATMTRVAFELLRADRMDIYVDTRNEASAAIPTRLGYTLDGTLRRRCPSALDERGDMLVFSLFPDEYPGSPCAVSEAVAWGPAGERVL